jgi:hypothetical protein
MYAPLSGMTFVSKYPVLFDLFEHLELWGIIWKDFRYDYNLFLERLGHTAVQKLGHRPYLLTTAVILLTDAMQWIFLCSFFH